MPRHTTPQERRAALAQAEQITEWLDRFNPFRCTGCGVAVEKAGDLCSECLDVLTDEDWVIEWLLGEGREAAANLPIDNQSEIV